MYLFPLLFIASIKADKYGYIGGVIFKERNLGEYGDVDEIDQYNRYGYHNGHGCKLAGVHFFAHDLPPENKNCILQIYLQTHKRTRQNKPMIFFHPDFEL